MYFKKSVVKDAKMRKPCFASSRSLQGACMEKQVMWRNLKKYRSHEPFWS